MNFEQIGKLFYQYQKCKFPGPLLRYGLIRFKNGESKSLDNLELTKLGESIITGADYIPITNEDPDFVETYMNKFKKEVIGINKTSYSPSAKVKQKLDDFFLKNNVTKQEVLDAVEHYHNTIASEGDMRYSLDAQYLIEKDGASLLIDLINEVKSGKSVVYTDELIF
jgi:hypothetical protein